MPPPVLKEGDDCPDSTLAVKGITNEPQYFVGDQPKFTMVVTKHRPGCVPARRRCRRAGRLRLLTGQHPAVVEPGLRPPRTRRWSRRFQPGEQVTTEVTWTGMGSAPQWPAAASADRAWDVQPRRAAGQSEVGRRCRSSSPRRPRLPRPRRPPNPRPVAARRLSPVGTPSLHAP